MANHKIAHSCASGFSISAPNTILKSHSANMCRRHGQVLLAAVFIIVEKERTGIDREQIIKFTYVVWKGLNHRYMESN